MNIGTLNCSSILKKQLENKETVIELDGCDDFPSEKLNGIFIDWVSQSMNSDLYSKQGAFVNKYKNTNTTIIIFDRYFSLEDNEIERLNTAKNVFLYEPRLITRFGFSYMPFCCEIPNEVPLLDDEDDKHVDLGYIGPHLQEKIQEFDYYYLEYKRFSGNRVHYNIDSLNKEKNKFYQENGLVNSKFSYSDCKCSIVIGSTEEYYTGYLPEKIFDMISHGCIPLLPEKHIYFYGLFKDLLVENMRDIDWYINLYQSINYGMRFKLYERIEKHYPLFNSAHLSDYIISIIGD